MSQEAWNPPEAYIYGDSIEEGLSFPHIARLCPKEIQIHPVEKFVLEEGEMDKARFDMLKDLLLKNPYNGEKSVTNLHTWDELKATLHATDEELDCAFDRIYAVEIDGYCRIVHCDYIDQMLTTLLKISKERKWSLSSLDEMAVVAALVDAGFSMEVACHCVCRFSTKKDGVRSLDTDLVSVQFALHTLLHYQEMTLEAFLGNWANGGLRVSLDMVAGEVLVKKDGTRYMVSLPPERYGPNLTPVVYES